MMAQRRKKWTEAEERTLIDKYGEMVSEGTLPKMKTREKKFRPIAYHVNAMHYVRDPVTYPWQWSWKDVSTKVQNMRHQYLLVKQKVKKPELQTEGRGEEFEWMDGLAHWSNFLRYKEVFGDVALQFNGSDSIGIVNDVNKNGDVGFVRNSEGMQIIGFNQTGHPGDGNFTTGIDDSENGGVLSLGFEYDGEEGDGNHQNNNYNDNNYNDERIPEDGDDGFGCEELEPNASNPRKKRKMLKASEKKARGFLSNQLRRIKETEARFAQREIEREQEKEIIEMTRVKFDQERERKWKQREKDRIEREKVREILRKQRIHEWESMEKESEENERRRREEALVYEREWEERTNRRRSEWKKRIDDMLNRHRVEMDQTQTRIVHEQQNLTNHLLGILAQCASHQTGLSDHSNVTTHYFSQMMQNLHHVNGMVHGVARVDEDTQEDQFIVNG